MTTKREKKKRNITRDITLYDFANSLNGSNRFKKPISNVAYAVRRELVVKDSWDDDEIINVSDTTDDNLTPKKQNPKKEIKELEGNVYPFDVWCLIGKHIRPEDVGRFALICKTSSEVVKMAEFWISLYKKYYKEELVPKQYQRNCLRYFGLRTTVIKALHFMYQPFKYRTNQKDLTHPEVLIGRTCNALSTENYDKRWIYYLRFQKNKLNSKHKIEDILSLLNDINANPDEDLCILKIESSVAVPVYQILGHTLKSASLNLSKGFCHHCLKMSFGSQFGGPIIENVVIDPVMRISILNWWHPLFVARK